MEDDAQAFIAELESRHGGPVGWRTYATWYGNNEGTIREFGVFFYWCADQFRFEDFQRTPSILGISLKPRRPQQPFVKFERSFSSSDVVLTRPVPKSMATKVIEGTWNGERIREINLFDKLFRQMVEMVVMTDGTIHFFELMNRNEFLSVLKSEDTR